jgi:hypothetical protein
MHRHVIAMTAIMHPEQEARFLPANNPLDFNAEESVHGRHDVTA